VKKLLPLAFACASTVMLAACGGGEPATVGAGETNPGDAGSISGTIRLYSYEDGFDPGYIASFREQYPNIKLETASFGSNEEAIAKLKSGFKADVINTCVDEGALEAVEAGLYAPLDTARLENWDDIWPAMKEMPGIVYEGKTYVVPVDAGMGGLIYNVDKVVPAPDSWTDLFDPKYRGHAALEDNAVTAINVGALAMGISDPPNMDAEQLQKVKDYLIEQRSQFRTWWGDTGELASLLKSGEVDITSGYTGTTAELQADGVNVAWAPAKEGRIMWTCGYGISPDIAEGNVDAAYALLNWYTSVPAQAYTATNWNYMASNKKVLDAVTPEVRETASLETLADLDNVIPASPPKDRAAWVKAWAEVKSS